MFKWSLRSGSPGFLRNNRDGAGNRRPDHARYLALALTATERDHPSDVVRMRMTMGIYTVGLILWGVLRTISDVFGVGESQSRTI